MKIDINIPIDVGRGGYCFFSSVLVPATAKNGSTETE